MSAAHELFTRVHGTAADWRKTRGAAHPVPDWTDPSALFGGLQQVAPVKDYLEVGSWLGGSAIHAGRAFPQAETLVCVDTWLGAAEHWIDRENPTHDLLRTASGQPGIFPSFVANIIEAGLADRVCPLRLPSTIAAEVLRHHSYFADVIYLDASHSYGDVLADCRAWWPLTRKWLVGDDWGDPRFGVAPAVLDFMRLEQIDPRKLQLFGGIFWAIEK